MNRKERNKNRVKHGLEPLGFWRYYAGRAKDHFFSFRLWLAHWIVGRHFKHIIYGFSITVDEASGPLDIGNNTLFTGCHIQYGDTLKIAPWDHDEDVTTDGDRQ